MSRKSEAKPGAGRGENARSKVYILGVGVDSISLSGVLTVVDMRCRHKPIDKPLFIVSVNAEFIMQAQRDAEFKSILNSADLVLPDGFGPVLASRGRLKEAVPGRKLVAKIAASGYKVFFLGGRGGVAQEIARKYGGEWDEGHQDVKTPEFQNSRTPDNRRIISKINKYRPDVLLVAYGAPWQEKWLFENRKSLKVKVMMGVGGTFDYLTGRAKLPPEWLSRWGLEWLWRLVHQPWRWRRQLDLIRFMWRVGQDSLCRPQH